MCASLAIGDSRSTNPALYTGLGTRPIVMEWFEFLDLKPHGSPFNSTSAYPKNRPASYFLEARRCPPALPSRGTSNPEISLEITSRGEYAALFTIRPLFSASQLDYAAKKAKPGGALSSAILRGRRTVRPSRVG